MQTLVYLSATLDDLLEERKAAKEALVGQGIPYKESYHVSATPLVDSCQQDIDECEVYVAIIGLRYGYCPEPDPTSPYFAKSITQIEFEYAQKKRMPCFIFIKSEIAAYQPKHLDAHTGDNANGGRIADFRRLIASGNPVRASEFTTPGELKEKLIALSLEIQQPKKNPKFQRARTSQSSLFHLLDGIEELAEGYDNRVEAFLTHYLGSDEQPTPFGGRSADLTQLDIWLRSENTPPYLLLAAPAGKGKSALVTRWAASLQSNVEIRIAFLPISIRYETAKRKTSLSILASRLIKLHGEDLPKGTEATDEYWSGLVFNYLSKDAPAGITIVAILDGIDEAIDWTLRPNIVPLKPGRGIRVLATARAMAGRSSGIAWLRALDWDRGGLAIARDLQGLDHVGIQDVLRQMGHHIETLHANFDVVNELYRLSEGGDPLLIRLYVEAIWTSARLTPFLSSDQLPRIETIGLAGFFERWWSDQQQLWGASFPVAERQLQWIFDVLSGALGPIDRETLIAMAPKNLEINSHSFAAKVQNIARFVVGDGSSQGLAFAHPRLAMHFWEKLTQPERTLVDETYVKWGVDILTDLESGTRSRPPTYALLNLSLHFERAKVRLEHMSRFLSSPWLQAWDDYEGAYAGYLADVERVWRAAASLSESKDSGDRNAAMLVELRCSLLISSINSLAGNIPPGLGLAMLRHGFWTQAQTFAFAQSNTDPATRAQFFSIISSELNGELKRKAISRSLSALAEFPADERRALVLTRLASFCTYEWGELLYSACMELDDGEFFIEALKAVCPLLTDQQFLLAIQHAAHIEPESKKTKRLAALAMYARNQEHHSALIDAVRTLRFEPNIHSVLVELVPKVSLPNLREIKEVVGAFSEHSELRLQIMLGLDDFSSEDERDAKIGEACTPECGKYVRYLTMRVAAENISYRAYKKIWIDSQTLGDPTWTVDIRCILAERFPELWDEVLQDAASVRYSSERAIMLFRLLGPLPADLIAEAKRIALLIADPYWRAPALAHLASRELEDDGHFRLTMQELGNRERWLDVIKILCECAGGSTLGGKFILECREAVPEANLYQFLVRATASISESDLKDAFQAVSMLSNPIQRAEATVALCNREESYWQASLALAIQNYRGNDLRQFIEYVAEYVPTYSLFDLRSQTRMIGDQQEARRPWSRALQPFPRMQTSEVFVAICRY